MKIGDIIEFGDYDWRVLDVLDGKALIITDRATGEREYHESLTAITWADCDLRKYLNGGFYNNFSEADRKRITETRNANSDNPWYGTKGCVDTTDKVFLLSLEEVVNHFGDSGDLANKRRKDTEGNLDSNGYFINDQYNRVRIANNLDGVSSWRWWLRSPGLKGHLAAFVVGIGWVYVRGDCVNDSCGVRPALWLKL